MKTIKGPGIFLAQFAGDDAPFNSLDGMARWAARLGFKGVQIPSWDARLFDLKLAAESQDYCDHILGVVDAAGMVVTELSTHLQGQLVATHPAYDAAFADFAPAGLIEEAFAELGRRWLPILDVFEEAGVDVCYELHPGEDLHDGVTFERFLDAVGGHKRANILYDPSHMILQQMDYLGFLDVYHERVRAFHVKDAEYRASARSGVYGGYQGWVDRPGRFRSLGDGQVDFKAIFSKLAQYDYPGWAVLEWECCLKHPEVGAAEGAKFIKERMIRVTEKAFDDFAGGGADDEKNKRMLGL
jgi:sugar phosphate isomerase/epimerase